MLLQMATSSRVSILCTFISGPRKKTCLTMFSQNPFAAAWYVSSSPWHPLSAPVERRLGGPGNQASSLEVSGKLEPGTPLEKSGQECCHRGIYRERGTTGGAGKVRTPWGDQCEGGQPAHRQLRTGAILGGGGQLGWLSTHSRSLSQMS